MSRTLPAVAFLAVVAFASPALAQTTSQPPAQPPAQPAAQPAQPAPSTVSSQPPSLGELAKQEEARRKAAAERGDLPKKVYTNHDLRPAPAPETTTDASGDQATGDKTADASKADDKSAQGDKDKKDGDKVPPEQTQPYWHDRMQKAKDDLQHNQMYAEALQSRINGLSADFAARDDPYQRAQIADDRQKALAELDRVHDEIQKGQQAISDIEDEARKANIPAGWIR